MADIEAESGPMETTRACVRPGARHLLWATAMPAVDRGRSRSFQVVPGDSSFVPGKQVRRPTALPHVAGQFARLAVRSRDSLFEQLIAEENMFKEVQITGVVRSTRTLDIFEVTIG